MSLSPDLILHLDLWHGAILFVGGWYAGVWVERLGADEAGLHPDDQSVGAGPALGLALRAAYADWRKEHGTPTPARPHRESA